MTASGLKKLYETNNPRGYFFCRNTMRFFGDTMGNFGVRDAGKIRAGYGKGIEEVDAWELYRKRPVQGGLHGHTAYFRKDNGQEIRGHE